MFCIYIYSHCEGVTIRPADSWASGLLESQDTTKTSVLAVCEVKITDVGGKGGGRCDDLRFHNLPSWAEILVRPAEGSHVTAKKISTFPLTSLVLFLNYQRTVASPPLSLIRISRWNKNPQIIFRWKLTRFHRSLYHSSPERWNKRPATSVAHM